MATERYNRIGMVVDMTLGDYQEFLMLAVANMITTGVQVIPNDAAQSRHFLMHLDRVKYGEYVCHHVLNNKRENVGAFPPTLQHVVDGCNSFL